MNLMQRIDIYKTDITDIYLYKSIYNAVAFYINEYSITIERIKPSDCLMNSCQSSHCEIFVCECKSAYEVPSFYLYLIQKSH